MNIIVVPFHDWRKGLREGFRDRDLHFVQHLLQHSEVEKVLVVSRPSTLAEVLIKGTGWKTPGDVLFADRNARLVQVEHKGYVLDCLLNQPVQHFLQRRKWYFTAFSCQQVADALLRACEFLKMGNSIAFSNTVFAAGLFEKILGSMRGCVFDADDNWLKFPHHRNILDKLSQAYTVYANLASCWITNSETNREAFRQAFGVNQIFVFKNAVDQTIFQKDYQVPEDLARIAHPIVGFGGRINHLMDVELLNRVVSLNRDKNFCMVGQVMDKKVLRAINRHPNMHYLGDRHYNQYPPYVAHFDVCIMPYVVGARAHGGDAIKIYEYMAAGKPVVATKGNGAEDLLDYVTIADNAQLFSEAIERSLSRPAPCRDIPEEFTWEFRTDALVSLLRRYV